MKINPEIFKAYDIRGVYGQDFDQDMAYRLGLAYVEMRREEAVNVCRLPVAPGVEGHRPHWGVASRRR